VYFGYLEGSRKLIYNASSNTAELYDLHTDPGEKVNLAPGAPEAVAAGVAKIVGTDRGRIREETETLLKDPAAYLRMSRAISPYGDGQAAGRITRHLASLIPGSEPPSTPQL